ncbi:hypothetical protein [Gulosibacter molinativorax]|uniref:Uncharacterized protein n=1 Tax=Gulosibacter molinativorax TaxID=256821 RepID=A0ABT7C5Q2_9MICO|nr:hypothetical protein [Gulosibacter molinativorax]MDJ1370532.1 hypothetical protein [Gulosibacter molinativorax]QUY62055.1 Hypotetical protein [Gulosibacter molinativorax]
MGDAVMLVVLGGAVLIAVVVKGFSALQRKLAPVTEVWEGDIVAAVIRFEQDPRKPGSVTPQSADVVIRRRSDGIEQSSFVGGVESLPESVREQVAVAVRTNAAGQSDSPRSETLRFDAAMFAGHGGVRVNIPTRVAVQVEEDDRGALHWTPLW